MLITKLSTSPTYSLVDNHKPPHKLIGWTLKWKQKQLIVKARTSRGYQTGLEIEDEQWLQECLQKSSVKIVQIDPAVGAENLKIWATACKYAKKPIFLRSRESQKIPYQNSVSWQLKRGCDLLAAIVLVIVLSPIILGLMGWQRVKSPRSPLFIRQWCVGQRGQLFQLLKFNFLATGNHENWQNLPQLFNILRGEMSLVGARPWALTEVVYLKSKQINALPGITGIPKLKAPLPLGSMRNVNLDYLNNWSLAKDLKILLQTVLRMFSGIN